MASRWLLPPHGREIRSTDQQNLFSCSNQPGTRACTGQGAHRPGTGAAASTSQGHEKALWRAKAWQGQAGEEAAWGVLPQTPIASLASSLQVELCSSFPKNNQEENWPVADVSKPERGKTEVALLKLRKIHQDIWAQRCTSSNIQDIGCERATL